MALFGFAINFNSGETSYALVSAPSLTEAESDLSTRDLKDESIESIVHYDAETIVQEQYDDCAVLGSEWGA